MFHDTLVPCAERWNINMEKQKSSIFKLLNAPIMVAIIGALISMVLNFQKIELRYTLSDEIPITLTEKKTQNVQQLIIKNTGKVSVKKIVINIDKRVEKYGIIKYSKVDNVKEFKEKNNLQIVYPELPKDGMIQINLISEYKISNSDIQIKYNNGLAVEALSQNTGEKMFYILSITMLGIWGLVGIYKSLTDFRIYDYKKYLKRKKKYWYITEDKWELLRKQSLDAWQIDLMKETIKWYSIDNISDTMSFKLLDSKPEYLREEEWEILQKKAEEVWNILNNQLLFSDQIYIEDKFNEYLKLEKPQYLEITKWTGARKKIISMLKFKEKKYYYNSEDIKKAYKFLDKKKEVCFTEDEWEDLIQNTFDYLKKRFYICLSDIDKYDTEKLKKYFKIKCPLNVEKHEWEKLQINIYEKYEYMKEVRFQSEVNWNNFKEALEMLKEDKPEFLPDTYWKQYITHSREYIEQELVKYIYNSDPEKIEKNIHNYDLDAINKDVIERTLYNILTTNLLLKSLQKNISKEEIPSWVDERGLSELKTYLMEKEQLDILRKENIDQEQDLEKLKERITKQLALIHAVFNDPKILDYIEDYSDVFAVGNFENLKKIAILIEKANNN